MNTIFSPQKQDAGNSRIPQEGVEESIYPYGHEVNIADGGEFLDDAIRMKDQPLGETIAEKSNDPLQNA